MEAIFLQIIGGLNSSVFVLLGVLVITCMVLFKLGRWTQKFQDHDKRVERVEKLSEKVVSINTKVDLIYQIVNPHSPVKSMSPASLTPIGKDIVEKIDAETIFRKYADKLVAEVEKMNPNNAYDIQKCSFDLVKSRMMDILNEEELIKVKKEAFDRGVLTEDIILVFGVLLRNCILEERGIPISEVDKCAPEKGK